MRRWRLAALGSALPVVAAAAWFLHTHTAQQPRPIANTFRNYLSDPRSRMVAYSPEQSVLDDPAQLRLQLATLREKFDGLSLYHSGPEMPALVQTAQSLGYRAVLLTVWDPHSESELATASSIVNEHAANLALAVSIGSEGLMENRYTPADMQSARSQLQQRSRTPTLVEMTTTEPWWFYLGPERVALRTFGDFQCINIHIVWDTDMIDPGLAAAWTRDRANEVRQSVTGPVLIRESGIPGGGSSPRNGMTFHFDRGMEAAFWQAWYRLDTRAPTVVFEGIDNPAKHWRDFEGSWGLLSTTLQPWPAWNVFPNLPNPGQP